jgi:hypothetical protein
VKILDLWLSRKFSTDSYAEQGPRTSAEPRPLLLINSDHGAKTIHMDSPLVDGNSIYAL